MTGQSFEKNNPAIAVNVLHVNKWIYILPTFQAKTRIIKKNNDSFLVGSNGNRWHYLELNNLSAFLRQTSSKHDREFYCLSSLHLFRTKIKLEPCKKLCENKDFYVIVMPSDTTKIMEFNQHQKSDETPSIIYADLESLI